MKLLKNKFHEYKEASEPLYKTPHTYQECVEIIKISKKGIFQVAPGKFSKTYWVGDTNYENLSEDDQLVVLDRFAKLLNSVGVSFKITTINEEQTKEEFERSTALEYMNDGLDVYRDMYNDIIYRKLSEGKQGIKQHKYMTITVDRREFEEAKAFFASFETNIKKNFMELNIQFEALDAEQRLTLLKNTYQIGCNDKLPVDFEKYLRTGSDYKNDIVGNSIDFNYKLTKGEYFMINDKYAQALYVSVFPNVLNDRFYTTLCNSPSIGIFTIDYQPVPREVAKKFCEQKLMGIEDKIITQQQKRNKNMQFSTDISLKVREEKKATEEILDDLNNHDQNIFFVSLLILNIADSKDELEMRFNSMSSICNEFSCKLSVCSLKQREAFNTILPIGVRQVSTMRMMETASATALNPFSVQELTAPGKSAMVYGINQISKNLVKGNRKKLMNGNGAVLGTPGSGKSMIGKWEMGYTLLNSDDDVLVIDPTMEFYVLADKWDGSIVEMSLKKDYRMNPMDIDDIENLDINDNDDKISSKCEFMLELCERALNQTINNRLNGIIDKCTREVYYEIIHSPDKRQPKLADFQKKLFETDDEEAKYLAESLDIFVNGSLAIFNGDTNIDTDNRFMVYGIRDIPEKLVGVAMLVMMENILQRIRENARLNKATRLYVDEFHVLLEKNYNVDYFFKLIKEVRKLGGLVTLLDQNIEVLLQNYKTKTIFDNCEFVILLKMSASVSDTLVSMMEGMTPAQFKYVVNATAGTGVMKHGANIIPLDMRIYDDSPLYGLFTTNFHEKRE